MKISPELRATVAALRVRGGDVVVPINASRLPAALQVLAEAAELLTSTDDGVAGGIADALPEELAREIDRVLESAPDVVNAFLARAPIDVGQSEWNAIYSLCRIIEQAMIRLDPTDPTAEPEAPWDVAAVYAGLSKITGKAVPKFLTAEDFAGRIPRDVVDAVLAVRTRWSSPALALDVTRVAPALHALIPDAELLGTCDDRVAAAIKAAIPPTYLRALRHVVRAAESAVWAFLEIARPGSAEGDNFEALLILVAE
jgi:O-acetyl-ADP-ribose deacetylase (regulator of RNase III)